MAKRSVPRSQRQYTRGLNNPALLLVSDRPEAKRAPVLPFIEPYLVEARESPPSTEQWVHEIKLDGYRLQLRINDGTVNCYTRRGRLGRPISYAGNRRRAGAQRCLQERARVLRSHHQPIDGCPQGGTRENLSRLQR